MRDDLARWCSTVGCPCFLDLPLWRPESCQLKPDIDSQVSTLYKNRIVVAEYDWHNYIMMCALLWVLILTRKCDSIIFPTPDFVSLFPSVRHLKTLHDHPPMIQTIMKICTDIDLNLSGAWFQDLECRALHLATKHSTAEYCFYLVFWVRRSPVCPDKSWTHFSPGMKALKVLSYWLDIFSNCLVTPVPLHPLFFSGDY